MSATNNLSNELNNLRLEYDTNESVRNTRNREAVIKATDHFLDTLVRSEEAIKQFETNAREAASYGKKLIQLVTWSGRGPTYLNQTLSELLDFGDLCARLQDYFDTTYGTDEFRVFHYPIRNTRTTALTVSWDKAGFDNADGIIRSNRERAQQRLESRDQPQQRFESRDQSQRFESRDQSQRFESRDQSQRFESRDQSQRFESRERPPRHHHHHQDEQPQNQHDQRPRRREHVDSSEGAAARGPWQPRSPHPRRFQPPRQDGAAPFSAGSQGDGTATRQRRRPVSAVASTPLAEEH
jgi:hypothetical protein